MTMRIADRVFMYALCYWFYAQVQEVFGLALQPYLQASLARASAGQQQQNSSHAFTLHAPPLL
jgi:hypothetical protein